MYISRVCACVCAEEREKKKEPALRTKPARTGFERQFKDGMPCALHLGRVCGGHVAAGFCLVHVELLPVQDDFHFATAVHLERPPFSPTGCPSIKEVVATRRDVYFVVVNPGREPSTKKRGVEEERVKQMPSSRQRRHTRHTRAHTHLRNTALICTYQSFKMCKWVPS